MVPGYAHDLFLSYAHAEAQWVEAFKKAFCQEFHEREGRPVSIWQDSTDLRPGTKWTAELENGVRRAAAVQYSGRPGNHNHPLSKSNIRPGSSMLRRRLSRIFHCEISVIGLGIMRP